MNVAEIGKTIKVRRRLLGITQHDLADIAEVSERTLRDIESGRGNPELTSLMKISEVLGLAFTLQVIRSNESESQRA
jgi:y4mF family transcriptional regulator